MNYYKLIKFLKINSIEYKKDVNLIKYNSLKINAISKMFIEIKSIDKLRTLLSFLNNLKINYFVLGNGSNTLFVDKTIKQVIVKYNPESNIVINNSFLMVDANMKNYTLSSFLAKKGYSNMEFLSVIPGTIGGGIVLNASFKEYSFKDNLLYIEYIDKKGNIKWIDAKNVCFRYRGSSLLDEGFFITRAIFKLNKDLIENIENKILLLKNVKRKNQPLDYPNCGSIFKNGELKAYEYINGVGLKGFRHKGAMISNKHSNFIINFNNASGKDVLFIIEKVKKKVYDKYKVNLILEITLVRSKKSV